MITYLDRSCSFGLLRACRERLLIFVRASFPFAFEDGMWDLIVLVPDHC